MLVEKTQIMDQKAMQRAITRISFEILERNKGGSDLCIIGIMSRGVELAQRIGAKINEVEGAPVEVGFLDITAFRDDIQSQNLPADPAGQSQIPFSIENKKVVLVDDVIYTGRTIRAAMDALLAMGRARSIQLAVLIDRGHRELPIRADYVGKNLPTSRTESVEVMVVERDGEDRVVIAQKEPKADRSQPEQDEE